MAKKGILGAILLAVLSGIIWASYPRARAVVSDQRNVSTKKGVSAAVIEMGFCQHYVVTDITDGYNVACINVYAGE